MSMDPGLIERQWQVGVDVLFALAAGAAGGLDDAVLALVMERLDLPTAEPITPTTAKLIAALGIAGGTVAAMADEIANYCGDEPAVVLARYAAQSQEDCLEPLD